MCLSQDGSAVYRGTGQRQREERSIFHREILGGKRGRGEGPLSHITVIIEATGMKGEAEGQRDHEAQKDLCYYKPNQI